MPSTFVALRMTCDRNASERRHDFGEHSARQGNTRDGKARCGGWMRMDDGVHIGPLPVDFEMHRQFGRRLAIAGELRSVIVDNDHHVGRHETLGDALRCGDETMIVEASADVPVVARDKAARVQPAAGFDNVGADLFFDSTTHYPCLRAPVARVRYSSRQRSEQK